ncbi:MAG: Transcriptional regulator, TetR family [Hydrocarboniphaga sp.]|uniref:TetR/AcrR family transcriptional regulator n=1 Tax=Hydrocarboniphaga sp. TaxID=2033016 RepID=UPI00262A4B2A|nr:TetR/AcrR family transcriptional regulator [Hydrocarboniphaga sp.]MDB5972740.1 Transcriptional regulator, TetR family [Hydrocarboniphaga sp.]
MKVEAKTMENAVEVGGAADANPCVSKSRVRDRIFDTACDLFYKQGIRGVGVDAIASEAGTNKMSFYRSFPSKDELVAEYVRDAARQFMAWWDEVVAPYPNDPRRQAEALFEATVNKPIEQCNRGCAMANVMVEIQEEDHAALVVVREHKAEIRQRLRQLAADMGASNPDKLGDSLMLVMGGTFQARMIFPAGNTPVDVAGCAAKVLIEAHLRGAC